MEKSLYIVTIGCQMNVLDSELIAARLHHEGYTSVDTPEEAETILFNTCSVREHAEDKIFSHLGRVRPFKEAGTCRVIGVIGCMAQNIGKGIFRRAPFVDFVAGPGRLDRVPALIDKALAGGRRLIEISLDRHGERSTVVLDSFDGFDPLADIATRESAFQSFVRIQIGCNNFCSYCIVPSVRGPEQFRSPEEIVAETRQMVQDGAKEITLLGQAVNSYRYESGDRTTRMSDLLYLLNEIDGLVRLKFVTNYPTYMTDDLIDAVATLPRVSPYLHVPAQSGSDRILKRMNRHYTVAEYREMIAKIYERVPGAAVCSDFIVGFCGETDEDFQATYDLVRECRFKNSFIFKYSERPGTTAAGRLEDDVPSDVKKRRNNELLDLQNSINLEENRRWIGRTVEILVEGPSRQGLAAEPGAANLQMTGRTCCDRIVVYQGSPDQVGKLLPVTINDTSPQALIGAVAD